MEFLNCPDTQTSNDPTILDGLMHVSEVIVKDTKSKEALSNVRVSVGPSLGIRV